MQSRRDAECRQLAWLALRARTTACGKKGPPLLPFVRVPAAVEQIAARRVGNDVFVTRHRPGAEHRRVDAGGRRAQSRSTATPAVGAASRALLLEARHARGDHPGRAAARARCRAARPAPVRQPVRAGQPGHDPGHADTRRTRSRGAATGQPPARRRRRPPRRRPATAAAAYLESRSAPTRSAARSAAELLSRLPSPAGSAGPQSVSLRLASVPARSHGRLMPRTPGAPALRDAAVPGVPAGPAGGVAHSAGRLSWTHLRPVAPAVVVHRRGRRPAASVPACKPCACGRAQGPDLTRYNVYQGPRRRIRSARPAPPPTPWNDPGAVAPEPDGARDHDVHGRGPVRTRALLPVRALSAPGARRSRASRRTRMCVTPIDIFPPAAPARPADGGRLKARSR